MIVLPTYAVLNKAGISCLVHFIAKYAAEEAAAYYQISIHYSCTYNSSIYQDILRVPAPCTATFL